MVYKRTLKRRTTRSKKRFTKRSSTKMARNVNLKRDVHFFKRSYFDGTIVGNALNIPYLQGLSFQLNRLPAYADYQTLFDMYKITYAKVYYHLKMSPDAQGATSAIYPKIYFVKDFDDSATPTTLNELREYGKCSYRVLTPNRPVVFKIKPSTLKQVYRTPTTSSVTPQWNQWIDMATTDVPHFGYKIGIDNLTNTNYAVDVEVKLWFQCKDTR